MGKGVGQCCPYYQIKIRENKYYLLEELKSFSIKPSTRKCKPK